MYKQNFVVVVKCDGRILREHENDVVYLPFGSEYSILLKNKDSRRALVDIEIDGENVLGGHKLIVNGNETQEIKGFMRDMNNTNRFRFIHKTKEIQQFRGDKIDDGLIRVTYQFEKYKQEPIITTYTPPPWFYSNGFQSTDWTSGGKSLRSSCGLDSVYTCAFSDYSSPRVEEGITVKGSEIHQNYNYGNVGLLESNINTIVICLKGLTKNKQSIQKPITIKTKIKCSTCGKSNKSNNKFCYNCGTFLK
jgi:hypothetical protein